jgi:hypothetical protein
VPREAGDGLGPDGLRAFSEGKRGTRDAAEPNNAVRMKKGCWKPRRENG